MPLLIFTFVVELFSAIAGFSKRKSVNNRGLKFFPIFLLIQFLNVSTSVLYSQVFHLGANTWMYNIFMVLDMSCFAYVFYHILERPHFKKIVVILTAVFYTFYFIDRFFLEKEIGEYLSYSRSLMGFNLVVFSLMYFYNLFDFTKPEENLTRKADFWIVIGIFFFYLTSTVILSALNYIILNPETLKYYNPNTMKFLAMSLYSFYIIGFLCHKTNQT
ncbi:MAG: hypothetical protein ABIP95_07290 [Pelobium sp.]